MDKGNFHMITVIYGPQGSGKTRFAKKLAKYYGCDRIHDVGVDGTVQRQPKAGTLVLQQETPRDNKPRVVRCIPIARALREAGIHFRPAARA